MSQSVKRAARILGSIAAEPKPVAVLAEQFGIHRSTMFRELQALEEVGFARRLADGRFAPGQQLAALGSAALENLDRAMPRSGTYGGCTGSSATPSTSVR